MEEVSILIIKEIAGLIFKKTRKTTKILTLTDDKEVFCLFYTIC